MTVSTRDASILLLVCVALLLGGCPDDDPGDSGADGPGAGQLDRGVPSPDADASIADGPRQDRPVKPDLGDGPAGNEAGIDLAPNEEAGSDLLAKSEAGGDLPGSKEAGTDSTVAKPDAGPDGPLTGSDGQLFTDGATTGDGGPGGDGSMSGDWTVIAQDGAPGADASPDHGRGPSPVNRAPVFISKPPLQASEGVAYRYTPEVDDLDGDLLSFVLVKGPGGMQLSSTTGALYWLVGHKSAGIHAVTLRVTDEKKASASQSWTITVAKTNAAPNISSLPSTAAKPGVAWSYQVVAADPDGDPLSYSLPQKPSGMAISSAGLLSWTPAAGGTHAVQLRVSDPGGKYASQSFQLAVAVSGDKTPPKVVISSPAEGAKVAGLFKVAGTVTDQALASYTIRACFAGQSTGCKEFVRAHLPVSGGVLGSVDAGLLAPGPYTIEVTARDAGGLQTTATREVEVLAAAQFSAIRLDFVDLRVRVGGLLVDFLRSYSSLNPGAGDFGVGWTLSTALVGQKIIVKPPSTPFHQGWSAQYKFPSCSVSGGGRPITFQLPDGRKYTFYFSPQYTGMSSGVCYVTEQWTAAKAGTKLAAYDKKGKAYTGRQLLVTMGSGSTLVDFSFDDFEPASYLLTTQYGELFKFSAKGILLQWTDQQKKTYTFDSSGVLKGPTGPVIQLTRNAAGRITSAKDPLTGEALSYSYDAAGDLTQVLFTGGDYSGQKQTFAYDSKHRMVKYAAPGLRMDKVEYDSKGRVKRRTDGTGAVYEYVYDDAKGQKTIISPTGAKVIIKHDAAGRVSSVTDPMGGVTSYGYDSAGREISRTDPLGRVTGKSYDSAGRVTSITDGLGHSRKATYDADGLVSSVTDELGHSYSFSRTSGSVTVTAPTKRVVSTINYNNQGLITKESDGLGNAVSISYDSSGRVSARTEKDGTKSSTSYDSTGLVATTTVSATNETVKLRRDVSGNPRQLDLSGGLKFTYDWTMNGLPAAVTAPLGHKLELKNDAAGRLSRVALGGVTTSRVQYNGDGNPVLVRDASGRTVKMDHDLAGRVTKIHTANGSYTQEWDKAGQRTAFVDPSGARHEFTYDKAGQITTLKDPGGRTRSVTYDKAGHPTGFSDPAGRVTKVGYDSMGLPNSVALPGQAPHKVTYDERYAQPGDDEQPPVVSRTLPSGQTWTYQRGGLGRLEGVTDPTGGKTTFAYGAGNRISSVTLPDKRTISYKWSGDLLASVTLPSGATTAWTYKDGRPHSEIAPDNTSVGYLYGSHSVTRLLPDNTTRLVEHSQSRLKRTKSPDAEVKYTHDAAGRLATVSYADGASAAYSYDKRGRPLQVRLTTPANKSYVTSYSHDKLGRLTGIVDPDGGVWSYSHDKADRLTKIVRPNGSVTSYVYGTALARPTLIEHRDQHNKLLASRTFSHDTAGRVASITGAGGKRSYSYDKLGRLAGETGSGGSTSFGYDASGNLTQRKDAAGTTTLSYDQDDRLLKQSGPGGSLTFHNDGRGNRTGASGSGGSRVFSYDALDRLTGAKVGGASISYGYDAQGLLVHRSAGTKMVRCLRAPSPLTGRSECLMRYDGINGSLVGVYVFDVHGVVSRHGGSARRYAHRGLHGSVVALSDSGGSKTASYDYDPFGAPRGAKPAESFIYGYAGAMRDETSGLIYLRARWYDPHTARFVTADRARADQQDPRTINRYVYVMADPLNKIDPSGNVTVLELNISMTIRTFLQSMKTIAVNCLRKKGIRKLVWGLVRYMVTHLMVESAVGIINANIGGWLSLADDVFEQTIAKLFCFQLGPQGEGLLFGVEQHVAIDNCGRRDRRYHSKPCKGLSMVEPKDSNADLVLQHIIPVDIKNGSHYKPKQLVRFCRAAAKWGSHLVIYVMSRFPPDSAIGSAAKKCFGCWARPGTCATTPLGSVPIFIGWDREENKLKMGIPEPPDLGC